MAAKTHAGPLLSLYGSARSHTHTFGEGHVQGGDAAVAHRVDEHVQQRGERGERRARQRHRAERQRLQQLLSAIHGVVFLFSM